tara:strand:- start:330 stop:608 length:279 start_codon:yes stop_codon:yes gene_type:complete
VLNKKIGEKMPKKKYKIYIDISKALKELKKLGLSEIKARFWIFTDSEDPDDACVEAGEKVYSMIYEQSDNDRYKKAAGVVKKKMKIIKIQEV